MAKTTTFRYQTANRRYFEQVRQQLGEIQAEIKSQEWVNERLRRKAKHYLLEFKVRAVREKRAKEGAVEKDDWSNWREHKRRWTQWHMHTMEQQQEIPWEQWHSQHWGSNRRVGRTLVEQ